MRNAKRTKNIRENLSFLIKSRNGFGLIEVTVSIYIITMGLLGLMSLVTQGLQVQYVNKNTIIAAELAQEVLELARNIRDDNWRDENLDWKQDIFAGVGNNKDYTIDYRVKNDRNIINKQINGVTDEDARLYINSEGFYQHYESDSVPSDAIPTLFHRIVEVDKDNNTVLHITCRVYWTERSKDHDYVLSTKLYNWKFPG